MRNFPEWSIAFWAAAAAGAIVVPLNAWWTADELEYGLAGLRRQGRVRRRRAPRSTRRASCPQLDVATVVVRADSRRATRCRAVGRRARRRFPTTPSCPRSTSGPKTSRRSSTRRAPPAARRARSARTATSAGTSSRSRSRRGARRCARARSRRRRRARTCTCSRCRSSTPPDATRCSSRTSRPAASSC